jgi:hypothetical protein
MGAQGRLFVAFFDVEQRVLGNGARFFFSIVCIIGLLFVLYHFLAWVLNLSPSFIIPTAVIITLE